MILANCIGITKAYAEKIILDGITFDIKSEDRIGLVGHNGTGKSTLANLLFGSATPDKGTIIYHQPHLKIGYLLQSTSYTQSMSPEPAILESREQAEQLFQLSSRIGIENMIDWEDQRYQGLSGGEKTKIALLKIWISKPDIVILDEPTNHMDSEGVEWLVDEIRKFKGAVIIISHNRYFLNQTVNQIMELNEGKISIYSGNYSFYKEEKERNYQSQLHQYHMQEKKRAKIEEEIKRLDAWSEKAHVEAGKVGKMADMRKGTKEFYRTKAKKMDRQVKSRIKRLEKIGIEGIDRPKDEAQIVFNLEQTKRHGSRILEAKRISKSFGKIKLFEHCSFYLKAGDKVALTGKNGCGKTTLIRTILQMEHLDEGEIWISPSLDIAYFSQEAGDLKEEQTPLETLELSQRSELEKARTLLSRLEFTEDMLKRPVRSLSLGERTRLKLAKLILNDKHLIIMDEPTNHLDIRSIEQLEKVLAEYKGTMLLVSHDRYFLEHICDYFLVFERGSIVKRYEQSRQLPANEIQSVVEEKMLLENRIIEILGKIDKVSRDGQSYSELDEEYRQLVSRKKELEL
ncbi:ribosomal protection-like ABC-F family protein [Paenibacillus piscarius]|uniref:ribosomal protection-like ABC-F family protein n=1 Tax=Paenibacillus piscarius TaxID=1089681 RepID=UPI001EE8BB89|nr:ABC-F type ribosomal protection protein [Paenibacillus piscarius]